ncbi:MAG: translocation/assembly module TamB domain-containing protein, partial [Phaeodactylibacter sp.]|nr:translocation/assembly module TamB domain-containing protein [Phaeodactylibacter sp.]
MTKWQRIARKTGRILAIILSAVLLLLLSLWIAIQRPGVQQFIADKVTNSLSSRLQTPFSIQNIELQFFNRVLLEGVYIEGLSGDTLLYAGRLEAQLGLFAPFRQRLEVTGIELDRTLVRLSRDADSVYNFQFLIDAFSSPQPDTSQAPSEWTFDIKKITVTDTRFSLLDSATQSAVYVKVGNFSTAIRQLNLPQQQIDIGRLQLKNSFCNFTSRSEPEAAPTSLPDTTARLEFPFPGWTLKAAQLQAESVAFAYDDFSQPPAPVGQFDPSHIHLEDILLDIRAFNWADTALTAEARQLSLREMNGFELQQLAGAFHMSPTDITLSKLEMETPGSRLTAPLGSLRFPEFASLSSFIEEVDMEMELSPSYFAMEDIRYWSGPIPYLKAGYSGKARLSGNLQGRVNHLSAYGLSGSLDDALDFQFDGYIRGLPETESLSFGINIEELRASYRGISRATEGLGLPAGLAELGAIRLGGYVGGSIDSLYTRNFIIRTGGYTAFTGKATARGLPDMGRARILVDISELRTQPSELAGFMEGVLPPPLIALGKMQYQGRFEGTVYDFNLTGRLRSEQGELEEEVSLNFNKNYSNANYTGQASLFGLKLGAILGDTSTFGATTMKLQATGSGLSLDSLSAKVDATVESITFLGYEYQDILVNGNVKKRQFEGRINVDDPHLCFQFDGLADLNDSLPALNFALQLDTAELAYLNLYPSALRLSTSVEARLKGNNLDNLSGFAALRRLAVADEQQKYFADSVTLHAFERSTDNRVLRFQSDFGKAELEGDYRMGELPGLLIEFVDGFFPIKRLIQPDAAQDSLLVPPRYASQDFQFSASLSRPVRLTRIFLPALQALDTASFRGQFNSEKRQLDFSGQTPMLQYSGLRFDTIRFSMQGSADGLANQLSINSLESDGQALLSNSEVTARMFQNSLAFGLNIQDDTSGQKLALQGVMTAPDEYYHLQLLGPLVLNGYNWGIPENNDVTFAPGYLNVENLKFARNQQQFLIQSRDVPSDDDFAPIDIIFNQFRLVELSRLAGLDEQFLSGALNGKATLSRPDTVYHYEVNLDIHQLMLDSQQVGDLALYATPSRDQEELILNVQLSGAQNAFALTGRYGLNNGQLGFNLKVEQLQMALADLFSGGAISNSRGVISGALEVKGTADKPEIAGTVGLDSVSTFVEYLQSRYLVPKHTIRLRENVIDIGRMELLDPDNRKATLEGQVTHRNLEDIQLNLRFMAPAFQVLNTSPKDNDLFYGKIMVSIDARINGPLEAPAIDVYTKTLAGTQLTALPLSEEEAIVQEGFILYGKPSEYQNDTSQAATYQTTLLGYELNLQL